MERYVKVADWFTIEIIEMFNSHGVRFVVMDGTLYTVRGDKKYAKENK